MKNFSYSSTLFFVFLILPVTSKITYSTTLSGKVLSGTQWVLDAPDCNNGLNLTYELTLNIQGNSLEARGTWSHERRNGRIRARGTYNSKDASFELTSRGWSFKGKFANGDDGTEAAGEMFDNPAGCTEFTAQQNTEDKKDYFLASMKLAKKQLARQSQNIEEIKRKAVEQSKREGLAELKRKVEAQKREAAQSQNIEEIKRKAAEQAKRELLAELKHKAEAQKREARKRAEAELKRKAEAQKRAEAELKRKAEAQKRAEADRPKRKLNLKYVSSPAIDQDTDAKRYFDRAMKYLKSRHQCGLALNYLGKLSKKGHTRSLNALGVIIKQGLCSGVLRSPNGRIIRGGKPQAIKYFRRAISQGSSRALLNLGEMYEKGDGLKKDTDVAIYLYGLSEQKGFNALKTEARKRIKNLKAIIAAKKEREKRHARLLKEGKEAFEAGKYTTALTALSALPETKLDPRGNYILGEIYARKNNLGDLENSIKSYKKALSAGFKQAEKGLKAVIKKREAAERTARKQREAEAQKREARMRAEAQKRAEAERIRKAEAERARKADAERIRKQEEYTRKLQAERAAKFKAKAKERKLTKKRFEKYKSRDKTAQEVFLNSLMGKGEGSSYSFWVSEKKDPCILHVDGTGTIEKRITKINIRKFNQKAFRIDRIETVVDGNYDWLLWFNDGTDVGLSGYGKYIESWIDKDLYIKRYRKVFKECPAR